MGIYFPGYAEAELGMTLNKRTILKGTIDFYKSIPHPHHSAFSHICIVFTIGCIKFLKEINDEVRHLPGYHQKVLHASIGLHEFARF